MMSLSFFFFKQKIILIFSEASKDKGKNQYIDPCKGFQCYPSFRRCPVTEKHFSNRRVQTDLM